jgi:hypothetical protein
MGGHAQLPGCGEPKRGAKIPGVSSECDEPQAGQANGKTCREGARPQGLGPQLGSRPYIGEAAPTGRLL